jgi:protein-L-isoaspartate(D-aspartate) O-methyltransferase
MIMDYALLRKEMVEEQLIPRGIKEQHVLDAFYKVERHKFIPAEQRENAYADFPLPIGQGQTISQPYIVALMSECLQLTPESKVLEIGTGSGYQTAILAELAKEVYSVERFPALAKDAADKLTELDYNNVKIKVGDGTLGWPEEAPFERIIITAACPEIPPPLIEQLKEGGKIIFPRGENFSQMLTLLEKRKTELLKQEICGCVFVPLVGKFGLLKK